MPRNSDPDRDAAGDPWLRALGARVRDARSAAELTQEQLAEMARTTKMTIYRIEYGLTDPSVTLLHRIAVAVRVQLRDLVG